jgi:hypothetical protein
MAEFSVHIVDGISMIDPGGAGDDPPKPSQEIEALLMQQLDKVERERLFASVNSGEQHDAA